MSIGRWALVCEFGLKEKVFIVMESKRTGPKSTPRAPMMYNASVSLHSAPGQTAETFFVTIGGYSVW